MNDLQKAAAHIVKQFFQQIAWHQEGHLPENNACWFDAGSEREVMLEDLYLEPAVDQLPEDFIHALVSETWTQGFDFYHGEEERRAGDRNKVVREP